MLLFIIIFFAMVIVVGVTTVAGFSIYLKRKNNSLESNYQKQFAEPPPFRSLFEPTDEELRQAAREEKLAEQREHFTAEKSAAEARAKAAGEFEKIWRGEPNRQNTVEFLRLAATSESIEIFSQMAENVIQVCLHEQKGILTAKDLADLLDSHLQILPQQERTSGAAFWLKEKIKNLRGKSE